MTSHVFDDVPRLHDGVSLYNDASDAHNLLIDDDGKMDTCSQI